MTAEEIAAGLSEAQRWAVQTGLCPSGQRRSPMKRSLEALGLWRPDGTFTPLCQQVRLVLGVKWLPGVKPVRAILAETPATKLIDKHLGGDNEQ